MYKTICYENLDGLNYNFEVEKIFEVNSTEFKFYLTNIENNRTSILFKNKENKIDLKTNDLVEIDQLNLFKILCSQNF